MPIFLTFDDDYEIYKHYQCYIPANNNRGNVYCRAALFFDPNVRFNKPYGEG